MQENSWKSIEVNDYKNMVETLHMIIEKNVYILELDLNGVIRGVTSAFCQLFSYKKAELVGESYNVVFSESKDLIKKIELDLDQVNSYGNEIVSLNKSRKKIYLDMDISNIFDEMNNKIGYRIICKDITDRVRCEELSIKDDLTGLFNRRHFNVVFQNDLNRCRREKRIFALFILDIDNFKLYNDTYGHEEGDRVLKTIAEILSLSLKRASDNGFRLGGEELAGIMTLDKIEDLELVIERLRENVENAEMLHEKSPVASVVTISIGVKFIDFKYDSEITMLEIYKEADEALYRAKKCGKNTYFFSTS